MPLHGAFWLTNSWTDTICPKSSDPFYIVTYYINITITTSRTYSSYHGAIETFEAGLEPTEICVDAVLNPHAVGQRQ